MQRIEIGPKIVTTLVVATFLCLTATGAFAATLKVASHGVDSPTCGSSAAPCRSIGRAIALAPAGAKILVGPGLYGDVNGNGAVGDADEEVASPAGMVTVDKPLLVLSTHGAGSTVIDASGTTAVAAVAITASGVVFGKKNKGFTIVHAGADGLHVVAGADGVVVAGNVALSARVYGFSFHGLGALVRNNWALRAMVGFNGAAGSILELEGNVASGNRNVGFNFLDIGGATVRRNVATANGIGFYLGVGAPSFTTLEDFSWNTVAANRFYGLRIDAFNVPEHGFTQSMRDNNVYGNGTWPYSQYANCGLVVNNYSPMLFTVDAAQNFWGAPSPGPDPGDALGPQCNYGGPISLGFETPAARPFRAKLKPMR